jgi:hypothetical protein
MYCAVADARHQPRQRHAGQDHGLQDLRRDVAGLSLGDYLHAELVDENGKSHSLFVNDAEA